MFYKFIQLKDLPDTPAGTVFRCSGIEKRLLKDFCLDLNRYPHYVMHIDDHIEYFRVGDCVFDKPEWFRKEIDTDSLVDLQCPACGGTKGVFVGDSHYNRDMDSDYYGVNFEIGFECVCGFVRPLVSQGRSRNKIAYNKKEVDPA